MNRMLFFLLVVVLSTARINGEKDDTSQMNTDQGNIVYKKGIIINRGVPCYYDNESDYYLKKDNFPFSIAKGEGNDNYCKNASSGDTVKVTCHSESGDLSSQKKTVYGKSSCYLCGDNQKVKAEAAC